MLKILSEIFSQMEIETPENNFVKIHSHTSKEQGLFLQEMFDIAAPSSSLEVGMAYGISSLFILQKHHEKGNMPGSHLIIEPYPWEGIAEFNFRKANLSCYAQIEYAKSDEVLPKLYYNKHTIQFAYIDTTKLFDVVMQDIYFIDKILDVNGIIVMDDCGGGWPGIQKAARFLNSLPHYKLLKGHQESRITLKRGIAESAVRSLVKFIPFKTQIFPGFSFRTNSQLKLNYQCLAFQKISTDQRNWNWDNDL